MTPTNTLIIPNSFYFRSSPKCLSDLERQLLSMGRAVKGDVLKALNGGAGHVGWKETRTGALATVIEIDDLEAEWRWEFDESERAIGVRIVALEGDDCLEWRLEYVTKFRSMFPSLEVDPTPQASRSDRDSAIFVDATSDQPGWLEIYFRISCDA